ncbi:MAG TPA: SdpI family protein [archaeon]|nr:SdpI family protein [archaeon]
MKKILWAAVFLIVLMVAVSAYFFFSLPENLITHWGIDNAPNGYSSKAFFFPLFIGMTVLIFLLFLVLPKIDPMKENYKKFRKYYDWLVFIFVAFMFYMFLLVILANYGFAINMGLALVPAFAVLFYFMGILLGKSKRNWFVGIRTPWTLSSDSVWEKTHLFAAKLFKALAIILLLTGAIAFYFETLFFIVFIGEILVFALAPVFYSYFAFAEEQKKHAKKARK